MIVKDSNRDSMPNELQLLEATIKDYQKILSKAVQTVVDENVSDYPILVIHSEQVEIGIPLMKIGVDPTWVVHISTLEELSARKVMSSDRIDDFKDIYKSSQTHLTVLYINRDDANVIFVPIF